MAKINDREAVYEAAQQWREAALLDGGSVFDDRNKIWTEPFLDELKQKFVQNPDAGEGSFLEKLKKQLSGGSPSCIQLMAEILWLLRLFSTNISASTKRAYVREIWSWSEEGLDESQPLLSNSVLEGIGSTGVAFNTRIWLEIVLVIEAMHNFGELEDSKRTKIASDPWEFSKWFSQLHDAQNRQAIHVIEHLLFPDVFENSSSKSEKGQILSHYNNLSERDVYKWDVAKIDRALFDLRKTLQGKHGHGFNFYDVKLQREWRGQIDQPEGDEQKSQDLVAQAREFVRLENFEGAIALLDEAINLGPSNVDAWAMRGRMYIRLKKYENAISSFDKAIEIDPNRPGFWNNRGYAKNKIGECEDAIRDLDRAIETNPRLARAWKNRGFAKNQIGQHKDAITDLDEAIRLNSNLVSAWRERGRAHLNLDNLDKAEENYEKMLEIEPDNVDARRGLLSIVKKRSVESEVESAERESKLIKGNSDVLLKREKSSIIAIRFLNFFIALAWAAIFYVVCWYFLEFVYPNRLSIINDFSFSYILITSSLLLVIFPLAWAIRMLMNAKEKHEILREDYYRRAMAEATIRMAFQALIETDDTPALRAAERRVWISYINQWMSHSSPELLLQYRAKSHGDGQQPSGITLEEIQKALSRGTPEIKLK